MLIICSKHYAIKKRSQNLVNLKLHYAYGMSLTVNVALNQVK